MTSRQTKLGLIGAGVAAVLAVVAYQNAALLQALTKPASTRSHFTEKERVAQYGPAVEARMRHSFHLAGIAYPPRELAYLAFKDTRILQVYARAQGGQAWRFVRQYPILRSSGHSGPKLAEGDGQVPEGLYRAQYLHPNSRFHLAIRIDYPNAFDKRMAARDGRTKLGGDIMIHGGAASIGCLAMGDQAAEDLFVMAALATMQRTAILISPTDFRRAVSGSPPNRRVWRDDLYDQLRASLKRFPAWSQGVGSVPTNGHELSGRG